jgi:hypothetical protein
MSPLFIFIGIFLAAYALVECLNLCFFGRGMTRGVIRVVRQWLHGSKEVELPEDLQIAAFHGLLTVGSTVVVGSEHQWDGDAISCFAISPDIVGEKPGTMMQVIRLTRNRIELKSLG